MAFTSVFHLAKPDYQTLRYDTELNLNFELIEQAILGFPSEYAPGSAENYPDVTPSDGMKWLDLSTHALKIYYGGSWHVIHTFT